MKKKLIIAFVLVDLVVFGVLAAIFVQPDTYRVERSLQMNAPSAIVFPYANNFRKWNEWSPWAGRDPNMKLTYEGPAEGEGAVYKWSGNDDVGQGEMRITASIRNKKVEQALHFIAPFESTASTAIEIAENDDGTRVTWSMAGKNDFMGKAFSLMMDMDAMIGADYEKGLASLKVLVEKDAAAAREKAAAEAKVAAERAAAEAKAVAETAQAK